MNKTNGKVSQKVKQFTQKLNNSYSLACWETLPFVLFMYGKVSQTVKLYSLTLLETLPHVNKTNGKVSQTVQLFE